MNNIKCTECDTTEDLVKIENEPFYMDLCRPCALGIMKKVTDSHKAELEAIFRKYLPEGEKH